MGGGWDPELAKNIDEQMASDYRKLAFDIRIPSGETRSGFVYTRLDLGTKVVSVVLFGPKQVRVACFLHHRSRP